MEQVLLMTYNIMNLGYTYEKLRLKNIPDIFHKLTHIDPLIAWIPSRLAWTLELQGRNQSPLRLIPPMPFSGMKNQEGPTTFDTLRGTLSGSQGALIPSTPNLISIYNTNP